MSYHCYKYWIMGFVVLLVAYGGWYIYDALAGVEKHVHLHFPKPLSREEYGNLPLDRAIEYIPDALSFVEEPLGWDPSEVVILTGGDQRRAKTGFAATSWDLLSDFSQVHGYRLVHILDLPFDKTLMNCGIRFKPYWLRVFAYSTARTTFPSAKFFIWVDDDVCVPYAHTDMLNHYLNGMSPQTHLAVTEDCDGRPLNSGILLMRNSDWMESFMEQVKSVGCENDGRLASQTFHEQEAITILFERNTLSAASHVVILPKRQGPYNLNTFWWQATWGDAFLHWAGRRKASRNWLSVYVKERAKEIVEMVEGRFGPLPVDRDQLLIATK